MGKEYLSNQVMQEEEATNLKDLEQFQNYSHSNRQQHNQTLKKINKCRANIFRAKSEKESSQQELSNISEKLQYAKLRLDRAEQRYQTIIERLNQLATTYNFCLINGLQDKILLLRIQKTLKENRLKRDKIQEKLKINSKIFKKFTKNKPKFIKNKC